MRNTSVFEREASSHEEDDYIHEQHTSPIRRAAPPLPLAIKRRSIPAGWIRSKEAPAFAPPSSFYPAPPFTLPPKDGSSLLASGTLPRKPKGPTIMKPSQRTHQRSKSSGQTLSQPPPSSFIDKLQAAPPLPRIPQLGGTCSSSQVPVEPLMAPAGMLKIFSVHIILTTQFLAINSRSTAGPSREYGSGHRRVSSTSGKMFRFQAKYI